jgi:hypothetical protein
MREIAPYLEDQKYIELIESLKGGKLPVNTNPKTRVQIFKVEKVKTMCI